MDSSVLIDLTGLHGQRGLSVNGCHAKEGDDPHPEDGAGAAHQDGAAGADDVTGTHLGGDGRGQSLERGHTTFLLATAQGQVAEYLLHAFAEAADLHEASFDGEDEAGTHQQENENVVREIGVDRCDDLENCSFHDFLFLQKNKSC